MGGRKEIGWEGGQSEGGRRLDWEGQRVGGMTGRRGGREIGCEGGRKEGGREVTRVKPGNQLV